MATKALNRPRVEFFATSSRLVEAYRSAAKRNRKLARWTSIHELGHASKFTRAANPSAKLQKIVLSHPDDDHIALNDARIGPMVSGAFHVLITEPSTHPDRVAQWMRATNIRSESRLHVVRVANLEAQQISELLGRLCSAFGPDESRGSIFDAYLAGNELVVCGPKHRMLHVPLSSIPSLKGQPRAVLQNFKIDPDGSFIHWPDLDVHLGWNQFLQAVDPAELHKVQQRSRDFNCRYGAAIRKVREAAGIRQSRIEGLTDRQVRRIEQGMCRATAGALAALAKAHGLDVNAYMDTLAKAMQ